MAELSSKQKRIVLITGALVFVAASALLFGWVAFNGEDTVQNRIAHTPSATVSLVKKPPEVPPSWTQDQPEPSEQNKSAVPSAAEGPQAKQSDSSTSLGDAKTVAPAITPPVDQAAKAPEQKPTEKPPEKAVDKTVINDKSAIPSTVEGSQKSEKDSSTSVGVAKEATSVTTNPASAAVPAWHKYAHPFDQANTKPRIALIVSDLGLASSATDSAIQDLPGEVTLAFSSMANDLDGWLTKARAAGHEALLTVPMEPENYPKNDPGPNSLLIALPDKENISRLDWALARADGYVGIAPSMGDKFVTSEEKLTPVMEEIKQRGLMIMDSTLNRNSLIAPLSRLGHIPFAHADVLIDASASRDAIDTQLASLEKLAKEKGQAIGMALPYPVTFEKLKAWIATLDQKGFVLAPVTALASEEMTEPGVAASSAPTATTPAAPVPAKTPSGPKDTPGVLEVPVAKGAMTSLHGQEPANSKPAVQDAQDNPP